MSPCTRRRGGARLPGGVAQVQLPIQTTPASTGACERVGQPILMYDEPRALYRTLKPEEEPAYSAVASLVRARGYLGLKAYLWARREGRMLRIFTERLPAQTDAAW